MFNTLLFIDSLEKLTKAMGEGIALLTKLNQKWRKKAGPWTLTARAQSIYATGKA